MGDVPLIKPPMEDMALSMMIMIDQVSAYRNFDNALGYSFLYFSTEMVKNKEIKLLSINGVAPNHDNIRSGKYPFTGEIYAVTTGNEREEVKQLIRWIKSEQGKEIISKTGYVPFE